MRYGKKLKDHFMPSFSKSLELVLHKALALAKDRRHEYATLEHLLLALTDERDAVAVIQANLEALKLTDRATLQCADVLVALIIIGREIAISALREWMAQIGATKSVAVHVLGKLKTTMQMVAIPFLLYNGMLFGVIDTAQWGFVLIWVAGVLTVWSMVYYLRKAWPDILDHAQ